MGNIRGHPAANQLGNGQGEMLILRLEKDCLLHVGAGIDAILKKWVV